MRLTPVPVKLHGSWQVATSRRQRQSAPGRDALKAVALGAKGTYYIGRAFLYGLGAMGEQGVTKAPEIIHKELDVTMVFCGRTDIKAVDTRIFVPGTYGGLSAPYPPGAIS